MQRLLPTAAVAATAVAATAGAASLASSFITTTSAASAIAASLRAAALATPAPAASLTTAVLATHRSGHALAATRATEPATAVAAAAGAALHSTREGDAGVRRRRVGWHVHLWRRHRLASRLDERLRHKRPRLLRWRRPGRVPHQQPGRRRREGHLRHTLSATVATAIRATRVAVAAAVATVATAASAGSLHHAAEGDAGVWCGRLGWHVHLWRRHRLASRLDDWLQRKRPRLLRWRRARHLRHQQPRWRRREGHLWHLSACKRRECRGGHRAPAQPGQLVDPPSRLPLHAQRLPGAERGRG